MDGPPGAPEEQIAATPPLAPPEKREPPGFVMKRLESIEKRVSTSEMEVRVSETGWDLPLRSTKPSAPDVRVTTTGWDAPGRGRAEAALRAPSLLDRAPTLPAGGAALPPVASPGTRVGVWRLGALIRRGGAGALTLLRHPLLEIVEIEHRDAGPHSDGYGRNQVSDRFGRVHAGQCAYGVHERDAAAGDRCRAREWFHCSARSPD